MKSLTVKICIVAIGAMLISNVFVARIALKNSIEILKSQMIESLEESVHAASEAMLASNEKEYKMLETLASLSAIRSTEVSLLEKAHIIYDAMILDKDYVDVAILDSEGKAWINNGEKMISFAEREYFYVPYQTGKRFYKEPFINKVTSTMAVFYSVPVFDSNNKVINVIFCVIDGFKPSTIASSSRKRHHDRSERESVPSEPRPQGSGFARRKPPLPYGRGSAQRSRTHLPKPGRHCGAAGVRLAFGPAGDSGQARHRPSPPFPRT